MTKYKNIDIIIIAFIFLILFTMPAIFVRIDGFVSWKHVFKIWQDNSLLIPVYAINHWLLLPYLMQKRKFTIYFIALALLIITATWICNIIDPPVSVRISRMGANAPSKIPPYANLLMYAILITGVDIGLYFSRMWRLNMQKTLELEKRNISMELDILKNQVSPHFFMNTLNNIYSLIDSNSHRAKEAVMKLSKLMRYLLYENNHGKVRLSKEFEFIRSYIDLMKLRYTDDVVFNLNIPDIYNDIEIAPMLFISYIENAVKYGISYQEKCEIDISFNLTDNMLYFKCSNPIHRNEGSLHKGGLGLKNSETRLSLIYGNNYKLGISEENNKYTVSLSIPVL